jgi:hypothetical protein
MYIGFELNILNTSFPDYYQAGKTIYDENKRTIKLELNKFLLPNGSLDGSKMQENWFPQVKADIFISHSHADENLAIRLAGWLYVEFGLKSFIDSCIWGYSNDLLKSIDDEYCQNSNGKTYNYQKRNFSTSHVHMMLSTALTMMIDKTECIFFLNTPNSITASEVISRTKSPWIYSEIATSKMIRKKSLSSYRNQRDTESYSIGGTIKKALTVEYEVNTDHLIQITNKHFISWKQNWPYKKPYLSHYNQYALDKLYEITNK